MKFIQVLRNTFLQTKSGNRPSTLKEIPDTAGLMNAIYKSILSAESIEDSIYSTIREFKGNLSFSRVSITLFDFTNNTYTPYSISDEISPVIMKNGISFPLEDFSCLETLKERRTCLVEDVTQKKSPSVSERKMIEQGNIRSYFLCPLIRKNELIGSLNFSSRTTEKFSKDLISFCEEVAHGIAISLHQYNLQEKIKSINATLARKEKDLTDSINYAKRIQLAKLPSMEVITECMTDCFVLFKPKDIVSGDFYFFRKNKGAVFIASADCTGHGVPGALMSMVCSEHLDDAISQTADTSQILAHLNTKIKYSLQQSDNIESTRDGMDIALCNIDLSNRLIKFAGANRPIWIIRQGQSYIEEIKGTKKGIGGLTGDKQLYDTHWIKLQHGDVFYLPTDGYADTFGGKENKKLMAKRFKEILLRIHNMPMEEQKQYLDQFIEEWKDGQEQVDDILVIGIRMP